MPFPHLIVSVAICFYFAKAEFPYGKAQQQICIGGIEQKSKRMLYGLKLCTSHLIWTHMSQYCKITSIVVSNQDIRILMQCEASLTYE
jgi:hypothetical protein